MSLSDMFKTLRQPIIKPKPWQKDVELILGTKENLKQAIDECIKAPLGVYGMDLETTGLDTRVFGGKTRCSIVGIGIAPTVDKAYYFPVGHLEGAEHNVPWRLIGKQFKRLFDSEVTSRPVLHNASFDLEFLQFNGFFPLGEERWDDHSKWEDTLILAYLLKPHIKGGRGLKYLSKTRLDMEMIELNDLMPDSADKDYSQISPAWEPSVWYAAADPLCTLRLWEVLNKEYEETEGASSFMYKLEKMCATAVRWMHRCRVYIDQETAVRYARQGQAQWFDSLMEVYKGASEILGRDIEPTFVKILTGEIKGDNRFDPDEVGGKERISYKIRVDEARKEAVRVDAKMLNTRASETLSKEVPVVGREAETESVAFPVVYDVLSPQQLGLLFRELKVPHLRASEKSGQVVTSKDVLDEVVEKAAKSFPFMEKIKTFRELGKALGQYLIPMIEDVGEDGTLKPKFDQFAADTGRFSCKTNSKPWKVKDGGCRVPFQGIPATYDPDKPECISGLRKCVAAREKGWWIAAIDYAGVELRLITNLSNEPLWINEFFRCSDCDRTFPRENDEQGLPIPTPSICPCGSDKIGDLHSLTAVAFYGEDAKKLPNWKAQRHKAKGCNFALSYGGSGRAVQRTIGCTEKEGEDKYNTFVSTYQRLYRWWKHQHQSARDQEYIHTAFGRRLPLPDIKSDEMRKRSKSERKSVNSPVQGTSADVTKIAMSLIYKGVKERGWMDKIKMILTVHDEIVFEIHESIIGEAIPYISEVMVRNKAIASKGWVVPLLVDVEIGEHWLVPYDLKDIKQGYKEKKVDGELVRVEIPEPLLKAFYTGEQESSPESPSSGEEESREVFHIESMTEATAAELARWLLDKRERGSDYAIFYQEREVTVLFS